MRGQMYNKSCTKPNNLLFLSELKVCKWVKRSSRCVLKEKRIHLLLDGRKLYFRIKSARQADTFDLY